MAYFDDETTRKKKAAALLLLMYLREHDEQLLTGPAPPLTGKNCLISLFHFLLFAFLAFDNVLSILFCFLFSKAGANRGEGGTKVYMYVGQEMAV